MHLSVVYLDCLFLLSWIPFEDVPLSNIKPQNIKYFSLATPFSLCIFTQWTINWPLHPPWKTSTSSWADASRKLFQLYPIFLKYTLPWSRFHGMIIILYSTVIPAHVRPRAPLLLLCRDAKSNVSWSRESDCCRAREVSHCHCCSAALLHRTQRTLSNFLQDF